MQQSIGKEKFEGSMVLLWIDGAVFVAPVAHTALQVFVPMLGAFQGRTDGDRTPTVLRLGEENAKAANALAAQINNAALKKTTKGQSK
ncbi:hypothetical protein ACFIQF_11505 [Comamonas sp. J-3]|uniref:hypothetical protein n=1 Tax=Comamonas trifloxystrobinivorans TaxID=3350256 RepID=UPI0037289B3E